MGMTITEMANINQDGITKHSPKFWEGYRAFVLGGRSVECGHCGNRSHVLDSSIEPYDYLSPRQKSEWRDGIEYAKKEREECLRIKDESYSKYNRLKDDFRRMVEEGKAEWYIKKKLDISQSTMDVWAKKMNLWDKLKMRKI